MGEPTEAALKVLAEKIGRYDASGPTKHADAKNTPTSYGSYLDDNFEKVATLDFSSERKAMSTVVSGYHGLPGN